MEAATAGKRLDGRAAGRQVRPAVHAAPRVQDKVSEIVQGYFSNFIKTGDPNGPGLPKWPPANRGGTVQVMRLDVDTHVQPEAVRERYLFLDQVYTKK